MLYIEIVSINGKEHIAVSSVPGDDDTWEKNHFLVPLASGTAQLVHNVLCAGTSTQVHMSYGSRLPSVNTRETTATNTGLLKHLERVYHV